jgi:hypothetical protein
MWMAQTCPRCRRSGVTPSRGRVARLSWSPSALNSTLELADHRIGRHGAAKKPTGAVAHLGGLSAPIVCARINGQWISGLDGPAKGDERHVDQERTENLKVLTSRT